MFHLFDGLNLCNICKCAKFYFGQLTVSGGVFAIINRGNTKALDTEKY